MDETASARVALWEAHKDVAMIALARHPQTTGSMVVVAHLDDELGRDLTEVLSSYDDDQTIGVGSDRITVTVLPVEAVYEILDDASPMVAKTLRTTQLENDLMWAAVIADGHVTILTFEPKPAKLWCA